LDLVHGLLLTFPTIAFSKLDRCAIGAVVIVFNLISPASISKPLKKKMGCPGRRRKHGACHAGLDEQASPRACQAFLRAGFLDIAAGKRLEACWDQR
jgi:hypothetical protein